MNQGIFITLEGIEGVGKSTHASFIANLLEERGRKIVLTREPGGTEAGESIRDILLSNKNKHKVSDDLELLLMFAARAQHLQEIIVPALKENKVVICDRFTDASYAYQGGGRGIPVERIRALEHWVQRDLRPDLTLLLDVCVETGLNRAGSRSEADRFESEAMHFFEKVRKAYLDIARAEQERVSIIDASGTIEEVQHEILKVLQDKQVC
jgi:dTMP kinase